MTNTAGAVQGTLTLTAFGQAVSLSGSSSDPYEYAATSRYRNDGDAGLMLVGCRYYDAQVGQFISRDTYLDQKPYAYCDGDPVNATDPTGHVDGNTYYTVGSNFVVAGIAGFIILALAPIEIPVVGSIVAGSAIICTIAYGKKLMDKGEAMK